MNILYERGLNAFTKSIDLVEPAHCKVASVVEVLRKFGFHTGLHISPNYILILLSNFQSLRLNANNCTGYK